MVSIYYYSLTHSSAQISISPRTHSCKTSRAAKTTIELTEARDFMFFHSLLSSVWVCLFIFYPEWIGGGRLKIKLTKTKSENASSFLSLSVFALLPSCKMHCSRPYPIPNREQHSYSLPWLDCFLQLHTQWLEKQHTAQREKERESSYSRSQRHIFCLPVCASTKRRIHSTDRQLKEVNDDWLAIYFISSPSVWHSHRHEAGC